MRPLFSIWSDYGTPTRKYRMSAFARGARSSVCRKIFLTAVIVTAAVIGIRGLYGHAVDKEGLVPAAHPQSPQTPSANPTGKRFAAVAAIPLSLQPALSTDIPATDTPVTDTPVTDTPVAPAPVPAPEPQATPVVTSGFAGDHAIPPALAAVPGAQAKAGALPQPARAAMRSADGPGSVVARRLVRVAHRARTEGRGFGGYAEAIAKLGHSRELRTALQMFL